MSAIGRLRYQPARLLSVGDPPQLRRAARQGEPHAGDAHQTGARPRRANVPLRRLRARHHARLVWGGGRGAPGGVGWRDELCGRGCNLHCWWMSIMVD